MQSTKTKWTRLCRLLQEGGSRQAPILRASKAMNKQMSWATTGIKVYHRALARTIRICSLKRRWTLPWWQKQVTGDKRMKL